MKTCKIINKRENIDDETFYKAMNTLFGIRKAEINFPGAVIGEKAILDNSPRMASIITCNNCDFLVLKKQDFL